MSEPAPRLPRLVAASGTMPMPICSTARRREAFSIYTHAPVLLLTRDRRTAYGGRARRQQQHPLFLHTESPLSHKADTHA